MKKIIFILSLIAAGMSFPALMRQDRDRRRNFLREGVTRVDDSYDRVKSRGRTYHDLKNVAVEWTRADPQLAAKVLCGFIIWPWAIFAVVHILLLLAG